MKKFFLELLKNIKNVFSGYNLFWHFLAISLTYIIVISDFDWKFFLFAQKYSLQQIFFPAIFLGGFLPFLLSLTFLILGKMEQNTSFLKISLAIFEATILAFLISGFYKAFTGRLNPPHHFFDGTLDLTNLKNTSHNFRFGFWRGGVFWGWPSTHTTISFSIALTLWQIFFKNKIVRFLVIGWAFYVGVGVSMTAIHWFSEFIAGAIIGSVIGIVVGKNFQEKN